MKYNQDPMTPPIMPTFHDPQEAFGDAITDGRLSDKPEASNYAGNFMYMGTAGGVHHFKNIETRRYLAQPLAVNLEPETR